MKSNNIDILQKDIHELKAVKALLFALSTEVRVAATVIGDLEEALEMLAYKTSDIADELEEMLDFEENSEA